MGVRRGRGGGEYGSDDRDDAAAAAAAVASGSSSATAAVAESPFGIGMGSSAVEMEVEEFMVAEDVCKVLRCLLGTIDGVDKGLCVWLDDCGNQMTLQLTTIQMMDDSPAATGR